jgi:hypothetical protein
MSFCTNNKERFEVAVVLLFIITALSLCSKPKNARHYTKCELYEQQYSDKLIMFYSGVGIMPEHHECKETIK